MPNLLSLWPVEMYRCVCVSTLGFTRKAIGAMTPLARSDTADRFEFLFAFDVETENVLFERVLDFLLRFPDAGECATLRVAAGPEHAEQFAP